MKPVSRRLHGFNHRQPGAKRKTKVSSRADAEKPWLRSLEGEIGEFVTVTPKNGVTVFFF
jgi:hypothetical protein